MRGRESVCVCVCAHARTLVLSLLSERKGPNKHSRQKSNSNEKIKWYISIER